MLVFNDMYEFAFLIANETVSPTLSNDLCKYFFIKLISYLEPLNEIMVK
jgi:hypothetical protein